MITWVKVGVHLACLGPVVYLFWMYRDGALAAEADPVNYTLPGIGRFGCCWWIWRLRRCGDCILR
jgi:hypothetical protein